MRCRLIGSIAGIALLVFLLLNAWAMLSDIIHETSPIERSMSSGTPVSMRVAVVLGAKTQGTQISNVLRARVQHAADLYHQGLVGQVLMTGGYRDKDPRWDASEASLARAEAMRLGVPAEHIEMDEVSESTWENLREARAIMRAHGWREAVLVSDRWHLARAQAMAQDLGMQVVLAPTPYSVYRSSLSQARFIVREWCAWWFYRGFGWAFYRADALI